MKTLTQKTEPSNTEPISLAESKRLIELEKVIEAGQQTFIEVGTALAEIRDARLYKADYKTFENYCVSKWGFKRAHAYRLIDAADVVKDLSPNGDNSDGLITESGLRGFIQRKGFTVAGISYDDFEKVFHDFLLANGIIFTSTDADSIVKLFLQGRVLLFKERFTPEAIHKLLAAFNPSRQQEAA